MAKKNGHSPMQDTKPKRGKPTEIPVPKRKDVFGDLGKVAKPKKPTD